MQENNGKNGFFICAAKPAPGWWDRHSCLSEMPAPAPPSRQCHCPEGATAWRGPVVQGPKQSHAPPRLSLPVSLRGIPTAGRDVEAISNSARPPRQCHCPEGATAWRGPVVQGPKQSQAPPRPSVNDWATDRRKPRNGHKVIAILECPGRGGMLLVPGGRGERWGASFLEALTTTSGPRLCPPGNEACGGQGPGEHASSPDRSSVAAVNPCRGGREPPRSGPCGGSMPPQHYVQYLVYDHNGAGADARCEMRVKRAASGRP